VSANTNPLAGWMANTNPSSSVQSAVAAASSLPLLPNQGYVFIVIGAAIVALANMPKIKTLSVPSYI
jgi:recombinational DNA repair protein RecT